jgi:PAS domain S-box-containing protein
MSGDSRPVDSLSPPEHLLDILGNMKVAVFRADAESRLISVNSAGLELLGARSASEVLGRAFAEFYVDPAERVVVRERLFGEGRLIGHRFRLRRLDGTVVWMETNMLLRRDESGAVFLEGFGREVTELVVAEQELRKAYQLLELVIQGAKVVITATDLSGNILIWNATAEATTGYRRDEVLGRAEVHGWLYPDPEYKARVDGFVRAVMAGEQRDAVEAEIQTRSGERRTLMLNCRRLSDDTGALVGIIVLGRDVTVEKALQQKLRDQEEALRTELERQVQERTAELERANRELKRLDEMKARFLGNISHELRTPLVSGLGYVNLVLDGGMGPISRKARKGLSISQQNLGRLAGLIDDLLAFTQNGPSLSPLQLESFPIRALIDECVLDLKGNLRPGVSVAVSVDDALPGVHADREKIRRVLSNLLTNAEKFTGETGAIEVTAQRLSPERLEVRVLDDGIGIPDDERERVFERLFRSSRTEPSVHRGTGIGLHLVSEILKAHGCSVRAEGRNGPGTAIVFTLPVAGT